MLDVVGRFVELVGWVGVLESEVGSESFDPVLCYVNLMFVRRGRMRLYRDKATGKVP